MVVCHCQVEQKLRDWRHKGPPWSSGVLNTVRHSCRHIIICYLQIKFLLFLCCFDWKVLSLLFPLLLQVPSALLSNCCSECYFQMGGTIQGSVTQLCAGFGCLSHLSHFTLVLCITFFSEVWRAQLKLPLLICPRGCNLKKHLNMVLSVLLKRAQAGGKFPLLPLSSSAVLSLVLGKGSHRESLIIPSQRHKAVDVCRHLRTL